MARWTKVDPPVAPGGDVGGDLQATGAYSVRFRPVDEPDDGLHAVVTDTWYGEVSGRAWRDDPYRVACQREYLICTDPSDPGSTEVWADSSGYWPPGRYTTAAEAEAAAKTSAEADNGSDIRWDGRSTLAGPARALRWADVELGEDPSLELTPASHQPDAGLQPGR